MPNTQPTIDEILLNFFNEAETDVHSDNNLDGTVITKAHTKARTQLLSLMMEVIGDDLPTDMYGSWTMNDGAKRRILLSDEAIITNKVKTEQRLKAQQLFNGGE